MEKVLIAMSGGVDSAVTAALLQQAGYEVAGATMLLHENAQREVADAGRSAERLGLEFFVFDWREQFRALVQQPFIRTYQAGGTPNPCVICNKTMKFGAFLDKALALGFDKIATGHYAKISRNEETGRYLVRMADDRSKDQTYMLHSLSQFQLSHALFPMGTHTKDEARTLADHAGLAVAHKHDSQDICFIPDGDYMEFLLDSGVTPQPGSFIGPDGKNLGLHRGQEAYTIGQRRGLDIPFGSRIYVTGKRGGDVYLGPNEALFSRRVMVEDVNFLPFDEPEGELYVEAKLRYTPKTARCRLLRTERGAELLFDEPQRAVTPGQSAVFYDGDLLLGGGTIAAAE